MFSFEKTGIDNNPVNGCCLKGFPFFFSVLAERVPHSFELAPKSLLPPLFCLLGGLFDLDIGVYKQKVN